MKKLLIVVCLLFQTIMIAGQRTVKLSLQFSALEFDLNKDEVGNTFITTSHYDASYKSDTLLPALPYISYYVLIGPGEELVSHSSTSSQSLLCEKIIVAPNEIAVPTNTNSASVMKRTRAIYSQKAYPHDNVAYTGTHITDGYKFLTFQICPFEYNAKLKKLYIKDNIRLEINLKLQDAKKVRPYGRVMRDFVRKMVLNGNDMEVLYGNISPLRQNKSSISPQTNYEYVIITTNAMKKEFQRLADWKTRKGIKSKVLTVEDIYSKYDGRTNEMKIKQAIVDYYSGINQGLKYVLLGGNASRVPVQKCWVKYYLNDSTFVDLSITACDWYYACLNTLDWDSNGNNRYGEVEDSVCITPDIVVSRVCSSDTTDAKTFVDRLISYESHPDTTNWRDDILMCGKLLGKPDSTSNLEANYYIINGDTISDAQYKSEWVYREYICPSADSLPSWNGLRTRFYDTGTDFENDQNYEFCRDNLQAELEKGYTFADVMTHGSYSSWEMEDSIEYVREDASSLNNSGNTIIVTSACHSNDIGYAFLRCVGTQFMNNPNSGILAYWGSSDAGWFYRSRYRLGPSNEFIGQFYRRIFDFPTCNSIGSAVTNAKLSFVDRSETYIGTYRWLLFSMNLQGDPEMPVFLSKPKNFGNVDIAQVNKGIAIGCVFDSVNVCLINQDSPEENYYVQHNVNGNVFFDGLTGAYDICITKPGYVPFTGDNSKIAYLQAFTFEDNCNYFADDVYIGSNVTDKVANGSVIIKEGKVSILATGCASITKDFEVKQGAEFEVRTE